jgi:hypothetical protein
MSCKGGERCTTCMEEGRGEAERHQNSLHLRRYSWSCAAILLPWLSPVNISEDRIQPDLGLKKEL